MAAAAATVTATASGKAEHLPFCFLWMTNRLRFCALHGGRTAAHTFCRGNRPRRSSFCTPPLRVLRPPWRNGQPIPSAMPRIPSLPLIFPLLAFSASGYCSMHMGLFGTYSPYPRLCRFRPVLCAAPVWSAKQGFSRRRFACRRSEADGPERHSESTYALIWPSPQGFDYLTHRQKPAHQKEAKHPLRPFAFLVSSSCLSCCP